ncbi:kelch-like, partial [Perkinsus olseni]
GNHFIVMKYRLRTSLSLRKDLAALRKHRWVDRNGDLIATLVLRASKYDDPETCPFASTPPDVVCENILPHLCYDEPVRNCVFVCGGFSSCDGDEDSILSSVSVYDHHSKRWCRAPRMNSKRIVAAAMCVDDRLYVIGGCQKHSHRCLAHAEVYDPWLNDWIWLRSTMQVPRFGHGLALVENRYLYAIGGTFKGELVSE